MKLMNVQRQFHLHFVRQILHKAVNVILVLVEVILDGVTEPLVQFQWQVILLVDSIEHVDLLLELRICLVVVTH